MQGVPPVEVSNRKGVFSKKEVSKQEICSILDAIISGSKGYTYKPCRFLYAGGKHAGSLIKQLGKYGHSRPVPAFAEMLPEAPAYLILISKEEKGQQTINENIQAVCELIQRFQEEGRKHGLGIAWTIGEAVNTFSIGRALGLRSQEKVAGIIAVGYFDEA